MVSHRLNVLKKLKVFIKSLDRDLGSVNSHHI